MNKAKRLWIALIVVALAGAMQFACGGTPPPPTEIPPTATPAPTSTPVPTPAPSADDHIEQGLAYLEQDQLDEAAAEFQKAIELDPENAVAHRNLGTAYGEQGEYEEAVAAYEKAIEIDPDYGEAYGDMAGILIFLDRISEAAAAGETAIGLAPDYANAHYNLGIAYHRQGELEKAVAEFEEAIGLAPDDPKIYNNLGATYYVQGRVDDAIDAWLQVVAIDPDYASAHKNLGVAYSDQGRIDEAITEFETYLRLLPDASDRAAVEEKIAELEEMAASPLAEYTNDEGGYSLLYPKDFYHADDGGWSAFSESQEAVETVFDYATEEAFQEAPVFIVDVMDLEDTLDSLDLGIAADSTDILEALIEQIGAEIDSTQTATLDGYPSSMSEISGDFDGASFKGALAVVIVDERIIGVFGLALPDQWDAFFPTYLDMINSLSFFEP
jgi:tetratricopeptide (TPR) repeat protein